MKVKIGVFINCCVHHRKLIANFSGSHVFLNRVIVVQMLIRDEEKKTNIHRFGDGEDIPVLRSLVPRKNHSVHLQETKGEILSILFNAAEHMDKISAIICCEYTERSNKLDALYHQFNSCLSKRI